MYLKPIRKFESYDAKEFGLRANDKDTHHPSLYMILKTKHLTHAAERPLSAEGHLRGKTRRNLKKRAKAKAKATAAAKAKAKLQAKPKAKVVAKATSKFVAKEKVRRPRFSQEEDERPPLKRRKQARRRVSP